MNADIVNLLVSIDKSAENLLSRYGEDLPIPSHNSSFKKSLERPLKEDKLKRSSKFNQQDRRARRTLRAKVNCILSNLPELCSLLSKKQTKAFMNSKKKKIEEINELRKKLNKSPVNANEISFTDSFDMYGNVIKQTKSTGKPLTPRTALKSKLTASELEMLKEDPVYFIQNEKYKYSINLDDNESWEALIDRESPTEFNKARLQFSKEHKHGIQFVKLEEEKRKEQLSNKISRKIEQAMKKKQEIQKKITQRFQNKFKAYSEKNLHRSSKDNIKITVQQLPTINSIQHTRNISINEEHLKKLDKVRSFLEKQKEINEKIMKFEKEAREAQSLYTSRLREQALINKINKSKERLHSHSRKGYDYKLETPSDKIMIRFAFNE